jgi:hypothetical protein
MKGTANEDRAMSAHRHKTWTEAANLPATAARLERLPAGLEFPDDFPEPIRFDAAKRRLVYRGFMCSVSYRYLQALTNDAGYQDALEQLFQATSDTLKSNRRRPRLRLWPLLVGAGSLVGATAVAWFLLQGK